MAMKILNKTNKVKGVRTALTFDDVLLVPQKSSINSRSEVDISTDVCGINFDLPIISANMDTVTDVQMANHMAIHGGLGVVHRHQPLSDRVFGVSGQVGVAVGLDDSVSGVSDLIDRTKPKPIIFVDVAHGHMEQVLEYVSKLSKRTSRGTNIVAGNVVTPEGAIDLIEAGADGVKVGIGNGAACSTRTSTGVGYPQLSAIEDVYNGLFYYFGEGSSNYTIIADGGIRSSGDIVKALSVGADAVMTGNLLAGTTESAGKFVGAGGGYKEYRGMASTEAREENGKSNYTPEGISGYVEWSGSLEDVLSDLAGGIRSGMSYCGAENIEELRRNAEFVRVTPATLHESSTRIHTEWIS